MNKKTKNKKRKTLFLCKAESNIFQTEVKDEICSHYLTLLLESDKAKKQKNAAAGRVLREARRPPGSSWQVLLRTTRASRCFNHLQCDLRKEKKKKSHGGKMKCQNMGRRTDGRAHYGGM